MKLILAGTKRQTNKQWPPTDRQSPLIKVNNRNFKRRSEMYSKLTIKWQEQRQRCLVNFEHISHLARHEKSRNTCFILEKRK